VAELTAEGLTNAQIAEKLAISERTVKYHLSEVYARLDVDGRSRLRERIRRGLPAILLGPWARKMALGALAALACGLLVVAVVRTRPADSAAPSPQPAAARPMPTPTVTPVASPGETYTTGRLYIPAIDSAADIRSWRFEPTYGVAPNAPELLGIAADRPLSADGGNIIWGHVDWYDGTPTPFARLRELERGDLILLRLGEDGPLLRYEVTLVIANGLLEWHYDERHLDAFARTPRSLTLLTHGGDWSGHGYTKTTRVTARLQAPLTSR
jgi:hypothetical protein